MAKIGDMTYFNDGYSDVPSAEEYKEVEQLIALAEDFAQLSQKTVYIFDYYKREFIYVSDNFLDIMEMNSRSISTNESAFCPNTMSESDAMQLVEQSNEIFNFMKRLSLSDRKHFTYSFSMSFSHPNLQFKRYYQVNTKMIKFRPNGDMWITLYVVSVPTKNRRYQLTATNHFTNEKWLFTKGEWQIYKLPALSNQEKQMRIYSAMGYTIDTISAKMNRSHDSIKTYRRSIFKKLEVDSISEAINFALLHHII